MLYKKGGGEWALWIQACGGVMSVHLEWYSFWWLQKWSDSDFSSLSLECIKKHWYLLLTVCPVCSIYSRHSAYGSIQSILSMIYPQRDSCAGLNGSISKQALLLQNIVLYFIFCWQRSNFWAWVLIEYIYMEEMFWGHSFSTDFSMKLIHVRSVTTCCVRSPLHTKTEAVLAFWRFSVLDLQPHPPVMISYSN